MPKYGNRAFLTGLAESASRGVDKYADFKMKLAEHELARQQKREDDKIDAQRNAFRDYLSLRGQSAETVRPKMDATGRPVVDARGNPVYETFQPIPEAEVRSGIDYLRTINPNVPAFGGQGQKPSGTIPQPKTSATVNPQGQIASLDYVEGLLGKIPTGMGTIGTAGASKVLGGERGGIGSDAIKEYEDAKPGTAVGAYRAITGDTRLSDSDARERALPFLPSVFPVIDTPGVRAGKLARLRRALELSANQRSVNPNAEVDFSAVMGQASKEIPISDAPKAVDQPWTQEDELRYQLLLNSKNSRRKP